MTFKYPEIEKLYEHLSQVSREAYKDQLLICNTFLSKQDTPERILESYLAGENFPKTTFLFTTKKLFLYLVKNILGLIFSIITAILHKISRQRFPIENTDDLIFLDSYFAVAQILKKGEFQDTYFPGASECLKKRKKNFAYIPRWFESKNPFSFFRVFRILKNQEIPVLTQFQILGLTDYLRAFGFIFLYPFSIFRFMRSLGAHYEDKMVYFALWSTFDGMVIECYIRFLLGQRLSSIVKGQIKCISWFENSPLDKNFFLGLREKSKKTEIVGAQLFVRPNTLLNIVPDEHEIPFKVVPDKILVNGAGYRFDSDRIHVDIGPSLRYKYLFDHKIKNKEFILVVMPYWDHITLHILDMIRKVDWPTPVVIKFHPTVNWKNFKIKIPENFSVSNKNLSSLLPKASITIGHSTGALVEATALGIPAIDIQYTDNFSHYYMPEIGKEILWSEAKNVKEVESLIYKFQKTLEENPEQLKEEGRKIKSFCFSEPTDELINQAFELN
jgi:hypothetical protein